MTALPWWLWVILAGLLGLAELHVPGSYLMWVALGAAVTSAAHAAFGFSLEGQLAVFIAASALSCACGYFAYRRWGRRSSDVPLNERGRAMIGAHGTVCESFVGGYGKVRLGDSVWLAAGPDLAEGTSIVVSGLRGTRLVVDALPRASAGRAPAS